MPGNSQQQQQQQGGSAPQRELKAGSEFMDGWAIPQIMTSVMTSVMALLKFSLLQHCPSGACPVWCVCPELQLFSWKFPWFISLCFPYRCGTGCCSPVLLAKYLLHCDYLVGHILPVQFLHHCKCVSEGMGNCFLDVKPSKIWIHH